MIKFIMIFFYFLAKFLRKEFDKSVFVCYNQGIGGETFSAYGILVFPLQISFIFLKTNNIFQKGG